MIDIATEHILNPREAARIYGRSRAGRPTHVSTIIRHITLGTRLPSGEIVRLEGLRLGGRWVTSQEAIQRYVERLTSAALGSTETGEAPPVRSAARERELVAIDRELDRVLGGRCGA
jgi:hypothetical protein